VCGGRYNQGLAIGSAVELWRATGSSTYLDAARRLSTAALSSTLASALSALLTAQ
jgi:hypothetical protein